MAAPTPDRRKIHDDVGEFKHCFSKTFRKHQHGFAFFFFHHRKADSENNTENNNRQYISIVNGFYKVFRKNMQAQYPAMFEEQLQAILHESPGGI